MVRAVLITEFFIPGKPEPQGSKKNLPVIKYGRVIKWNIVEDNKRLRPWRTRVTMFAHQAMGTRPAVLGPIRLDCAFVLPRIKSAPKTFTPWAVKKPDLDKCVRAICDSITGTVIVDDAQVVALWATKRTAEIGEQAGVTVRVRSLEPAPAAGDGPA